MEIPFFKDVCKCLGNNPKCIRCGGWGYLDTIGIGRASGGSAGVPIKFEPNQPTTNEKFARSIDDPKFLQYATNSPSANKKQNSKKINEDISAKEIRCPDCRLIIKLSNLEKDKKYCQGKSSTKPTNSSQLSSCPHCKALVRSNRLSRHIARVHRGPKSPMMKAKKQKTKSSLSTENTEMDATRHFAHSYRDHGQFGSHPSHDRFDGESNA